MKRMHQMLMYLLNEVFYGCSVWDLQDGMGHSYDPDTQILQMWLLTADGRREGCSCSVSGDRSIRVDWDEPKLEPTQFQAFVRSGRMKAQDLQRRDLRLKEEAEMRG